MHLFRKSIFLLYVLPLVMTSTVSGQDPEEEVTRLEGELLNSKMLCRKSQAKMSDHMGALRQELIAGQGQLESLAAELVDSKQKTVAAQNKTKTCMDNLAEVTDSNNAKPATPFFLVGQQQIKQVDMIVSKDQHVLTKKTPRSTGPDLQSPPQYAGGSPGNGKADQAVSPLAFPDAPNNTNWLYAHLDKQIGILRRLYTGQALQSLGTQERDFCKVKKTRPYCIMQLRLYWISNAL